VAAVLDSMGRRREALSWMRWARRRAAAQRSPILVFFACLRGAALAAAGRQPERALPYLQRALAAGAAKRIYVHPWLRRSEMARLLAQAIDAGIETDYASELLQVLGLSAEAGTAGPADKPFRLATLGTFDILHRGKSVLRSVRMQKGPAALAVQLVAAGPAGDSPEALIDRLWESADEVAGRNRLKSTVYRLRQLFGDPEVVLTVGGRIALNSDLVSVDAWEVEALARASGWSPAARHQRLLALYGGPFTGMQGGDVGALVYRHHIDGLVSDLFAEFAEDLVASGEWSRALAVAREGLSRLGYTDRLAAAATRAAEQIGNAAEIRALTRLLERESE